MSSEAEKIKKKVPWLLKGIRIPTIKFPELQNKNLDIPTPGRNILLGVIYVFLFFLISGGVYLLIPDSNGRYQIALGADRNGNPIWVYPSVNDAFIIESFVAGSIIFLGSLGFIMLYMATRHMYNTAYAQKLIALGFSLALLSFIFLQYLLKKKGGL
ncbi:MAG: hypothetical protein ACTSU2_07055 [Promethearchaeota archaeon]